MNSAAHAATSWARIVLRMAFIRLVSSLSSASKAWSSAVFMPLMSCGLTSQAWRSSAAAPANSESTSAPSSSRRQATYSLATRFIPSR